MTLAIALLVATLVPAVVAGLLLLRWARRSPASTRASSANPLARRLVLLLFYAGLYASAQIAPLNPHVEQVLSSLLFVAAAFVAARLVSGLIAFLLAQSISHIHNGDRERIEREYVPLGSKVATLTIGLVFVIAVLKHFGTDVSSLVAALGIGSLAIGLAAQQTLGNMLAGFTLLVDRPFRPGDRIRLASSEVGEVVTIGMRSTRIQMADSNLLIVPNTELVNSRVVNLRTPARAEVKVLIAKAADVERALTLMEMIASERRLTEPHARVSGFPSIGIELSLSCYAGSADIAALEADLRRALVAGLIAAQVDVGGARPAPINR